MVMTRIVSEYHDEGNATNHMRHQCSKDKCGLDPITVNNVNEEAIGQKWDTGKAPVFQGFVCYFPRAIAMVALVSQAGSNKYAGGQFPTKWREVPLGQLRYADAQGRHMLEEAKGELFDDGPGGTNCLHLAQEAWNNLARLELFLQEEEEKAKKHKA